MILPITAKINPCKKNSEYKPTNKAKIGFVSSDAFYRKVNVSPVFGSVIPREELYKLMAAFSERTKNIKAPVLRTELIKEFILKDLKNLLQENRNVPPRRDSPIYEGFLDEIGTKIFGIQRDIAEAAPKKAPDTTLEMVKPEANAKRLAILEKQGEIINKVIIFCIDKWQKFEEWQNMPGAVSASEVVDLIKKMPKGTSAYTAFSIKGTGLIKNKKTKDPVFLYELFYQPLQDFRKAHPDAHIKVKINKTETEGLYVSFIDPDFKFIPGRVSENPFRGIEEILKKKGIKNIKPNYKPNEGTSIRVPLFGLED